MKDSRASVGLPIVFLFGYGLVVSGIVLLANLPPKPPMKDVLYGVHPDGREERVLVPADEEAEHQWIRRAALFTGAIVCVVAGVTLVTFSVIGMARLARRPIMVLAVEGDEHFHESRECPRMSAPLWLFPRDAVEEGFKPCPSCGPPSGGLESKVVVRDGQSHFHRKGCPLLPNIISMPKSRAVEDGLKPCPECALESRRRAGKSGKGLSEEKMAGIGAARR
jgi:hypothetical protein